VKTNVTSIEIQVPSQISLSYQFLREPDEDNRDYISQNRSKNVIPFNVTMPKFGNYMLCLYAKRDNSDDKSAPNVYNFLLQNVPEENGEKPPEKRSIFKKSLFKKGKSKDEVGNDTMSNSSDVSSNKSS